MWRVCIGLSILKKTFEKIRQFEVRDQMKPGSAHVIPYTQPTQLTQRPWCGCPGRKRVKVSIITHKLIFNGMHSNVMQC